MTLNEEDIEVFQTSKNKNALPTVLPVLNIGRPGMMDSGNAQLSCDPSDRIIYVPCSEPYPKYASRSVKNEMKNSSPKIDNRKKIQVCFLGKFIALLAFVTSVVSFLLISYNYFNHGWSAKTSLPYHESEFEGTLLLIQSAVAMLSLFPITSIIVHRKPDNPISNKCYYLIVFTVGFLAFTDGFWVCYEMRHVHGFQLLTNETLNFKLDFESYHDKTSSNEIPPWMDKIQTTHDCCGVYGPEDWIRFPNNVPDIPDSCCARITKGCGKNYFLAGNRSPVKVFTQGCATSLSRLSAMTYRSMNFIHLAKLIETIYLLVYSFVTIFCINSFGDSFDEYPARGPVYFPKPGVGFTVL